jgi:NADH-quinone oxidoreductase subunit L
VIYAMHHAYDATHKHEDAQDIRNMGGLRPYLPWTATLMWIATLAIAGIPPFSGFFSKDEILGAAFARATAEPAWYAYWALGVAAALLTAFYMTRLMLYTFHGPNRTGDAERAHLHEAPWMMTGPLALLGAASLAGGVINLPKLVGGNAFLHHWLEPVTAAADRIRPEIALSSLAEWTLLVGAVAVAALGIVGAVRLLKPEALVPARLAPSETGFGRVLWKKWYVDEIYDAAIVRPLMWLSRDVLWRVVDLRIVDGLMVNGSAAASRALGWVGSRLQTGQVGAYVTLFVVGVLVLLGAALR